MTGIILQLSISGIAMGSAYALVVIEYTPIWNSTGPFNFSHDGIVIVGAYMSAATFTIKLNIDKPLAIVPILMLMGISGSVIASGIFSPLQYMRFSIFAVMETIMLGRILIEAIRLTYGPVPPTVENQLSGTIKIGILMVAKANVITCVVAVLVVTALQLFMNFTKIGKIMRCVAQNKKATALTDINVAQNICVTTAVSFIICNVIGMLIMPLFNISTATAISIDFKGSSAGVIGGSGYLPGAILGGLFIGVVENLAVTVPPAIHKDIVPFVLLIILLLVYPSGFLGKKA